MDLVRPFWKYDPLVIIGQIGRCKAYKPCNAQQKRQHTFERPWVLLLLLLLLAVAMMNGK